MLVFPEWSDLSKVSNEMRFAWENEIGLRDKYRRYFDGLIFKDTIPVEAGSDEEAPLLYPVGLNLVKMLCLAQTDAMFGEWEDQIVSFEIRQDLLVNDDDLKAVALANQIATSSELNSTLWEIELDRNIYGGGAMKIAPSLKTPGFIKWSRVPLQNFFPIWDPDEPNKLLEVYTVTGMSREQAAQKYGYTGTSEIVQRVEHWNRSVYENTLDGTKIAAFSGINPWGVVPFEYFPRYRSNVWWGDSLAEDVIASQDELNMRIGDLGEAINYNAHPVRWGFNLPRGFNIKNFPLSPNALWDLGRVIGNSPEPKVGMLEASNPIPAGTFDYIKFVYDWSRVSNFAPPIVFGEDNGGGQRSGSTLELRMWSLVKACRRSRSYMSEGLIRALSTSGQILNQKRISGVPVRAIERFTNGTLIPRFAPVMPKDHQAIVDETVKLLSTTPPGISLDTAQKELGRGVGEVERIKKMVEDRTFYPNGFGMKQVDPAKEGADKGGENAKGTPEKPKDKTE